MKVHVLHCEYIDDLDAFEVEKKSSILGVFETEQGAQDRQTEIARLYDEYNSNVLENSGKVKDIIKNWLDGFPDLIEVRSRKTPDMRQVFSDYMDLRNYVREVLNSYDYYINMDIFHKEFYKISNELVEKLSVLNISKPPYLLPTIQWNHDFPMVSDSDMRITECVLQ